MRLKKIEKKVIHCNSMTTHGNLNMKIIRVDNKIYT